MLQEVASRALRVFREEGLTSLAHKAVMVARYSLMRTRDSFDTGREIDTTREVPLWRLRISSANAKFGFRYQPSDPAFFSDVLKEVPANFANFVFVDLGCGKGRTLIMASQYGFKKIVGVEFSHELAEIAKRNVAFSGITADVIEGDASHYGFPDDNLLVYMYNPFGCPVMDSVVRNLLTWRQSANKFAYVAYLNPKYRGSFDSIPQFSSLASKSRLSVWRLDRAA